jgi:hypothetical protein
MLLFLPSCRKQARQRTGHLTVRSGRVLGNAVAEGPVLFLHLDKADRSALRLQDRGQPNGARARGGNFRSNSVAQPYSVKPVTVMSDVFDCLQVHYGMSSDPECASSPCCSLQSRCTPPTETNARTILGAVGATASAHGPAGAVAHQERNCCQSPDRKSRHIQVPT